MDLMGCGTALVTPFRRDKDASIDETALHALVNWQIERGIGFLVSCGTTGEASTLSEQEWQRTIEIELTVAAANGRVPVLRRMHAQQYDPGGSGARRSKIAKVLAGLSGILTASPYYNRPGQEGQYQHFSAIAQAVELPILLYNIPSRTGTNLEPATVARLAEEREHHRHQGVERQHRADYRAVEHRCRAPSRGLRGDDDGMALPTIALGGCGLISVASNQIPGQMAAMVNAALDNDWADGAADQPPLRAPVGRRTSPKPSPAPVKAILAMMGQDRRDGAATDCARLRRDAAELWSGWQERWACW